MPTVVIPYINQENNKRKQIVTTTLIYSDILEAESIMSNRGFDEPFTKGSGVRIPLHHIENNHS